MKPQYLAHRRPVQARAEAGFALIEVLVSLLLFSLGVLGMVAMQAKASNYSVDAEDRSRASRMANELVASMWAEQTVSPSILTKWQARVADPTVSGLPNGSAEDPVKDTDATTGVSVITVTIIWKAPSKTSSDNTSTYFTQLVLP